MNKSLQAIRVLAAALMLSKSQAVIRHERGAVTAAVESTGGPPSEQLTLAETLPPDVAAHMLSFPDRNIPNIHIS